MDLLTIYSESELKRIQEIEYSVLKEIIRICDSNGIEYFLSGGTALGAVRHNGFIPWDDDIDIGMTRKNYRKFIQVAPDFLPPNLHLQTPDKNGKVPYFYTKIRIDGTLFMEYCNRNVDMHHGVYVDIFPYDNVPDDEEKNIKQFKKVQRLIRVFSLRQIPDVSEKPKSITSFVRAVIRRLLHYVAQLLPSRLLFSLLESAFTEYEDADTSSVVCLNFPIRNKDRILKEDLYPLVKHKFCDGEYNIPNNWDAYLSSHYGNYMAFPPENERYGHKPYRVEL